MSQWYAYVYPWYTGEHLQYNVLNVKSVHILTFFPSLSTIITNSTQISQIPFNGTGNQKGKKQSSWKQFGDTKFIPSLWRNRKNLRYCSGKIQSVSRWNYLLTKKVQLSPMKNVEHRRYYKVLYWLYVFAYYSWAWQVWDVSSSWVQIFLCKSYFEIFWRFS